MILILLAATAKPRNNNWQTQKLDWQTNPLSYCFICVYFLIGGPERSTLGTSLLEATLDRTLSTAKIIASRHNVALGGRPHKRKTSIEVCCHKLHMVDSVVIPAPGAQNTPSSPTPHTRSNENDFLGCESEAGKVKSLHGFCTSNPVNKGCNPSKFD